jgi:predicted metal-dependent phosphoesterase TrpH
MKRVLFSLLLATSVVAQGQIRNDELVELTHINQANVRTEISIPNFDQYQTLKCDFHIHTVFSDGNVWPTMRVSEAWQEGLDAIAMTDHIEYRPHKDVLKGDLNESFKIAKKTGDNLGFIVIQGTEITRSKPLGHLNALFINDANPMDVKDPLKAIDIALEQGAFIQWNHPGWPDDKSTFYPVHEELLKANKIHGVEVLNYMEYYPVVFDWVKKYNISPMANTDIHGLVSADYGIGEGKMRPMTLVFATSKTEEGIKEALFARRTAALFDGKLFGQEEYLMKLIQASLQIRIVRGTTVEITNISDIPYEITCNGAHYIFPARKTVRMTVPKEGDMVFENCFVGMNQKLTIPEHYWSMAF